MASTLELKFRVDEVPAEGRPFAGELSLELMTEPLAGLVGKLGYRIEAPVGVSGTVYKSAGGELVVDARLKVRVGFDCVRCLNARTLELQLRHDHVFTKTARAENVEQGFDEAALIAPDEHRIEGEEVDLTPVLREDVLLAMPMNPSCQSQGAVASGPCADLRSETDQATTIDPRWAPLLKLKNELN